MLTIDLSMRSTGYCVWKENQLIKYGVLNTDKGDNPFIRAKFISDELIKLALDNEVTQIFIEAPAFGAKGAFEYLLKGSHFYVIANLYNNIGIEAIQVAPTTIKKQFTGSGRAKKEEIIKHMPKDVLTMFEKDYVISRGLSDLCDAYALGWIQFNKLKD